MITQKRMTWDEMVAKYPDQWIGVVDAEIEGANIRSGVVKYVDKTIGELSVLQFQSDDLISVYTTPDNLAPMGVVGGFGCQIIDRYRITFSGLGSGRNGSDIYWCRASY